MITIKNNADVVDLYIYGEITSYPYEKTDVSANDIREVLEKADGKPLNVYINSGGGDVFEGQAISAMLERYEGKKTCYIDGICASIATKIPFACDTVYYAKGAYFMIHRASCLAWGNYDEMLKTAATLEQIDNGLVATYKAHSRMTDEEVRSKMRDETWYTSETINNDFSFNIVEGKKMAACVSHEVLNKYTNRPDGIKLKEEPNNILKMEFALL